MAHAVTLDGPVRRFAEHGAGGRRCVEWTSEHPSSGERKCGAEDGRGIKTEPLISPTHTGTRSIVQSYYKVNIPATLLTAKLNSLR